MLIIVTKYINLKTCLYVII